VEGTYSDHALFLTGGEDLTGAGMAVADDSAGCWAASTSHRRLLPPLERPLLPM
jgi:hypothetical protein